jgi:hypothetical protein
MSTLFLPREVAAAEHQQEQLEQNFIAYGFICNFYLFITSLNKLA